MVNDRLYCCLVSGIRLNDDITNALFDKAKQLCREHKTRTKIRGESFEGLITTTFESAIMGSLSGLVFTAELDVENRTGKVTFLVRDADLPIEDREWEEELCSSKSIDLN